jgi:hypothetical protein
MTDRIIESFGGLFNDRDDGSAESHSTGEHAPYFYTHSDDSSEGDINENTDTEDGAEDLIELISSNTTLVHELVDANSRLIAFLSKQRETLARLRSRISRMKRHIEDLTFRLNDNTEDRLKEHDAGTFVNDTDDIATVLVDTDMDASLLLLPNSDSK